MKPKSRSKQSRPASAAPCLPLEVTELCLRFYAQLEQERVGEASESQPVKHIGLLRLVSRHFRDLFAKELFDSVTLHLFLTDCPPAAFLKIVRKNNDILKLVRHVTILFHHSNDDLSQIDAEQACTAVGLFSQAPLTALTIEGLDVNFPHPPIFNALHALRCVRSLQTLDISGSAIPPFLVCGHFASTQLKSIHLLSPSAPDETSESLRYAPPMGPDSILASGFQPLANIEELEVLNGVDVPKYFPLQDFGSIYYPSNGRIPFTLPALRTLGIGNPDRSARGVPLRAQDYKVLGTILSRAPRLETLFIIDHFWRHEGLDAFAPLMDQLPFLKGLRCLKLIDPNSNEGESMDSISNVLGAFPPVPSLKTLDIDFRWSVGDVNATRTTLYFSDAWQKLQWALASSAMLSLRALVLNVLIEVSHGYQIVETFGPEEVEAFKGALVKLYSRDGNLDVTVNIEVDDV